MNFSTDKSSCSIDCDAKKKFCLIGFIDCDYRHDERKDWKKQRLSSKRQLQGDEFPATFKIRISSRISDLGHR